MPLNAWDKNNPELQKVCLKHTRNLIFCLGKALIKQEVGLQFQMREAAMLVSRLVRDLMKNFFSIIANFAILQLLQDYKIAIVNIERVATYNSLLKANTS